MRHYFLVCGLAFLFFSVSSCQPTPQTEEQTAGADNAGIQQGIYRQYTGTIGELAVGLHLCMRHRTNPDGLKETFYYGFYWYDNYQEPILIEGSPDSTGKIILLEYGSAENSPEWLIDALDAQKLTGTWKGSGELPIQLKAAGQPAGSIAFTCTGLLGETKLRPDDPNSPGATTSLSTLWPQGINDPALDQFLRAEIAGGILGDSASTVFSSAADLLKKQQDEFVAAYQKDMSEFVEDTTTFSEDNKYMYSYDLQSDVSVVWNENNLLSLAFFSYVFSGGAHGNYATGLASYDLSKKRLLGINDVFKPGFEATLDAALEKSLRKKFGLAAKAPLTELLFEESFSYTDNFCLTGKGILFNYPPYEIAAYAVGEIKLFVPFSDVKSVLQPAFVK